MLFSDLPPSPAPAEAIVVTAERAPERQANTPASVTLVEPTRVQRLGEPLLASLLRLTPSAALAEASPAGSQTQLRIRGSEANHTLLFVDGIRANDPAAGNEPRFELLSATLGDRLEIVRGPQSALWGSEAIGGVVSVTAAPRTGLEALAEIGSHDFGRVSGSGGLKQGDVCFGITAGLQGSDGINSFAGGSGDKDGYRNRTLRSQIGWARGPFTLSASGFAIVARSEFDGYDPATFLRADTRDESRNRLAAGRLGAAYDDSGWKLSLAASHLSSRNRNLLDDAEQNRTKGRRTTVDGQIAREFTTGMVEQRLTLAAEWNRERFIASDTVYGGFTNQKRSREQTALTGEWRAEAGPLVGTVAVRRDRFSEFRDATTARAGALVRLGQGWQLAGSFGSGIAQPTFFDLYGFFPGSFLGNPDLKPEKSRGGEISLRKAEGPLRGAVTYYRQRLNDEIVGTYDPASFLSSAMNSPQRSRREGVEVEAGWSAGAWLNLTATHAYLDASEPAGRELRRPRHSGSVAADGEMGRLSYGAAQAYTGARRDNDFDLFPNTLVRLDPYWLASARIGYRLNDKLDLFGRVANAFDSDGVDVVGYRREGRAVYAGIRARLGG